MTYFSQAVILLLRGLVFSAVFGLESRYSNDQSNTASSDGQIMATGKNMFTSFGLVVVCESKSLSMIVLEVTSLVTV